MLAVRAVELAHVAALIDFDNGFAAAFLTENVPETFTFGFVLFCQSC